MMIDTSKLDLPELIKWVDALGRSFEQFALIAMTKIDTARKQSPDADAATFDETFDSAFADEAAAALKIVAASESQLAAARMLYQTLSRGQKLEARDE